METCSFHLSFCTSYKKLKLGSDIIFRDRNRRDEKITDKYSENFDSFVYRVPLHHQTVPREERVRTKKNLSFLTRQDHKFKVRWGVHRLSSIRCQ